MIWKDYRSIKILSIVKIGITLMEYPVEKSKGKNDKYTEI